MQYKIVVDDNAKMPLKIKTVFGNEYYLYSNEEKTIKPKSYEIVNTGAKFILSQDWAAIVKPKKGDISETVHTKKDAIFPENNDYVFVKIKNCGEHEYKIKPGKKIANIFVFPATAKQKFIDVVCNDDSKHCRDCPFNGKDICSELFSSEQVYEKAIADYKKWKSNKSDFIFCDNSKAYFFGYNEKINNKKIKNNKTVICEYNGDKYTLNQLSEIYGLPHHLLYQRIVKYGWSVEKALNTKQKN